MAMHDGVALGILVRSEDSKERMLMSPPLRWQQQPVAVDVSPSCLKNEACCPPRIRFNKNRGASAGLIVGGKSGGAERRIDDDLSTHDAISLPATSLPSLDLW